MTTPIAKHHLADNSPVDTPGAAPDGEPALLVHLELPAPHDNEDPEELSLLAESAGARVCGTVTCRRNRPDAATFIGKGKAEEIAQRVQDESVSLVLVNHDLSPAQERNLERIFKCRVLDRTGLILDIFAQRARSHEGKLQVELAQLEHLSTRLVRGWTHLERQKGGIGLRGPGETQLETDRRLIRERIKHLNRRLEKVQRQRKNRRMARRKVPIPTISFVGYTNAGKSSLFNQLTGAGVYAADQLFATLDPTMRRLDLPGNMSVVLADTVGFIRHLPHDLVEAFKSTLEEVQQADVLIHVVDVANPEAREHMERVNEVLEEICAREVPQILVYNKIDLSGDTPHLEGSAASGCIRVWLSAHTGEGMDLLLQALADHYRQSRQVYRFHIPPEGARLRARLYENSDIQDCTEDGEGGWWITLMMTPEKFAWLTKQQDYREEYLHTNDPVVLAPTGS